MHGSGEIHTGYIYKKNTLRDSTSSDFRCDPMFRDSWNYVRRGLTNLNETVGNTLTLELHAPRPRRR